MIYREAPLLKMSSTSKMNYLTNFRSRQGRGEFGYSNHKKWAAFQECLPGDIQINWDEVVDENYKDHSTQTTDDFKVALEKISQNF